MRLTELHCLAERQQSEMVHAPDQEIQGVRPSRQRHRFAVAVIIGAAFGTITTSLVNDIIMPPLGLLLGGVDFSELFVTLGSGTTPRWPRRAPPGPRPSTTACSSTRSSISP